MTRKEGRDCEILIVSRQQLRNSRNIDGLRFVGGFGFILRYVKPLAGNE